MAKAFDAIIFGATGFTGKFVVENACDVLKDFKWAIAGRNKQKLEQLLHEVGQKLKQDLSHVPIVMADVEAEETLNEMASKCKVILNCVGPYILYGERMVRACLQNGTHHVDLSAEPQYVDGMHLKYHQQAQEQHTYIISTCAFGSVPADLGVVHAEQNFNGTVNSVEGYLENRVDYQDKQSKAVLHHNTWDSMLEVISQPREMARVQKEMQKKMKIKLKPKLKLRICLQKPQRFGSYFLPFPADRTVVQQTQHLWYEAEQKRPIQYESYAGLSSLLTALFLPIYIFFILIMAQFKCTLKKLHKNPDGYTFGLMTKRGPTLANMDAHYFSWTFKARGWPVDGDLSQKPKLEQWTRVSGYNPYYGITSVILLAAAKTLLTESELMPASGGVLTPGFAFGNTSFIQELGRSTKYPLKFEVLPAE